MEVDPLVEGTYETLRELARSIRRRAYSTPSQTTSILHEAYLRLHASKDMRFSDPQHFLRVAARAMRYFIVDSHRHRSAKRRKAPNPDPRETAVVDGTPRRIELLDLDEALAELDQLDQVKARVVELRYFGGCTIDQVAEVMELSPSTVARHWDFARVWLMKRLDTND